jgi:hypothetical protein
VVAQGCPLVLPSALQPQTAPRVIDQNHSHYLSRKAEEMGSILPVRRPLIAEPEIEFVDQPGGLQSVARMLALRAAIGYTPQIGVNQRKKRLKGVPLDLPSTPGAIE